MRPKLPYRGWLFDLDGTVYLGDHLIPGAAECLAALRAAGRRIAFLTNKPLQTRTEYAAKLTRLGCPPPPTTSSTPRWCSRATCATATRARRSS